MCDSKLEHEIVINNFNKCKINGCFEKAKTYHFECKVDMANYGFKIKFYRKHEQRVLCKKHFDQYALHDFKGLFYDSYKVIEVKEEE